MFEKLIDFFRKNKLYQEILFYGSVFLIALFSVLRIVLHDPLYFIGAAFGVLGLVLYFIVAPETITELLGVKDKNRKKGFTVFVKIVVVFIIVILIYSLLNNHLPKIDLTSARIYTVSNLTKDVLSKLDDKLVIKYFVDSADEAYSPQVETISKLLDYYAKKSKYVELQKIDPNIDPLEAKKYGITSKNTIVLLYKGKRKDIYQWDMYEMQSVQGPNGAPSSDSMFIGEKLLTSSIKYLLTSEKRKMYFITGHDEKYINDYQDEGYSSIKDTMGEKDMDVENVNLLQEGKIPSDCDILVIAAPNVNYSESELKIIGDYIDNGGKYILIDDIEKKSNIYDFIYNKYNIEQMKGVVVDNTAYYREFNIIAPVLEFDYHSITESIQASNRPALVITAKPLKVNFMPDDSQPYKLVSLLETKDSAFNEIYDKDDVESQNQPVVFDESKGEEKGRRPVAVLVERKTAGGSDSQEATYEPSGVIFADSDMFANFMASIPIGNMLLFENSVNYLVGEMELLDIGGKVIKSNNFVLNSKQAQVFTLIVNIFVPIGLPLIFLFAMIIIPNMLRRNRMARAMVADEDDSEVK